MQVIKCWRINPDLNAYAISIRITHPSIHKDQISYAIFDPGFTGYCGLDSKIISSLDLPRLGTGSAIIVSGKMEFENYQGFLEIIDEHQQTIAHVKQIGEATGLPKENAEWVPIQKFKLPLIGIQTINQFSWLIAGKEKLLCLVTL